MPSSPSAGRAALTRAAVLLLAWVASCAFAGGPPIQSLADEINATLTPVETRAAPGDLLEVRFVHATHFDQEVMVQPDGSAGFLMIDRVPVGGETPAEITARLKQAYTGLIDSPDLVVSIKTPAERSVSVLGEVRDPGAIPIGPDGRLTLIESIARAGGHLKESAHLSSTVLVRWDARASRQIAWTIDARPEHWASSKTIFLQEHDLVFIPNTPIDDVGIWVENHITRTIPLPVVLPFVF